MSYADGNSGKGRKALTGSTVALIQIGIGVALVHGLAVHFIPDKPQKRTGGVQIALPPPPPQPIDTPKPTQTPEIIKDTFKTPDPIQPVTVTPPAGLAGPVDVAPAGSDFTFIPPVAPSNPPERFIPKAARPSSNAAQWVTTDDYPTSDIRLGHTGTVRFRLAIDARGRVTDCTIVASSGYEGLDKATCRNLSRRARFEPATDANGEKVAGSYAGTIRWVIPQD